MLRKNQLFQMKPFICYFSRTDFEFDVISVRPQKEICVRRKLRNYKNKNKKTKLSQQKLRINQNVSLYKTGTRPLPSYFGGAKMAAQYRDIDVITGEMIVRRKNVVYKCGIAVFF